LDIFKSNEPWALKSYAYSHILGDAGRQAVLEDESLLSDLVSEMEANQKTEFDPILNLKRTLRFSGRKDDYIRGCATVSAWFVAKYGKKQRYTRGEILEFLDYLDKRYTKGGKPGRETSTYVTKVTQFKTFLQSLPEDETTGRKQVIPYKPPAFPTEFHQPAFSPEEIDRIIYAAVMDEKPDVVLRLAAATIYGCRLGEVAGLSSKHMNLVPDKPTIAIPTAKKGERKHQPIPIELLPLFRLPPKIKSRQQMLKDLKRVCRKAGVTYPLRGGVHCIRRSVVTALWKNTDLKEISIQRFMRWSSGRGMGVMPKYVKTPVEVTDLEVLSKHPYVSIWQDMVEFLPYLPQYEPYLRVQFTYTKTGSPPPKIP